MTSKNDITGDLIKSKSPNQKYLENYDKIFRKKDKNEHELDENKGNNINNDSPDKSI